MSGSIRKTDHKWQRYIIFGFVMLAVYLLQSVPGLFPAPGGISPLPLIPLAAIIAMYEGELSGAIFGLVAGLLMDATALHTAGFSALTLMVIGCACGLLTVHLMRNTILACLTLCTGAAFLYGLLHWLFFDVIAGREHPFSYLLSFMLPRALYTTALSIPLYLILRWLVRKKRKKRR